MGIFLAAALASAGVATDPPSEMRAAIEVAVRAGLKDPESARFKWIKVSDSRFYCGFVNAKNALGGYVGFEPFYVDYYKTSNGKYEVGPVRIISSRDRDTSDGYWVKKGQCEGVYGTDREPEA